MMYRSNRRTNNAHRALVEACEVRRMFVTYQVDGTAGADSISISISGNSIISAVNGVSDSASDIINNTIEINGLGGNDTISITETGNNTVIVNAGSGNDTINVGNGANQLGIIDGNVTINGDADVDQAIFHDSASTVAIDYTSSFGNRLSSNGMPTATINTENIRINGGSGANNMFFNDPPTSDYLFTGGGGANLVSVNGAPSESVTYRTGGQSGGSGAIDFPVVNTTAEFFSCPDLIVNGLGSVTMRTSFQVDSFGVSSSVANGSLISGVSGAPASPPADLFVRNDIPICTIDMGTNDGASTNDSLVFNGNSDGNTLFRVDMGTGTNTISVNGDHHIDTRVGVSAGHQTGVTIDTASVAFHGLQEPASLTLRDNANASFVGTGSMLSTPSLQIPASIGNLTLASGQTGAIASAFAIAAGAEFIKKGGGTLTINPGVVQSHAATANMTAAGGTLTINGDVGTAASRKVNLGARTGGLIQLNTNQHVHSLFADAGIIRMATFGTRVIVTDFAGVNTDTGGQIDLANNQLILDYPAGPSQVGAIRDLLVSGYAGGSWNGMGLMSNIAITNTATALGYADAPELFSTFPASFSGETIDSSSVVVRHTRYGDTNLDRTVNFDDLLIVAQQYGPTVGGHSWHQGNFNYNTADVVPFATGFDDLLLLAQNYLLSAIRTSVRVKAVDALDV